jgi:type IX secretion system PorP/SprF family membrane protein
MLLAATSYGQQQPLVTQYWEQMANFNPAAAGLESQSQLALLYRDQWTSLPQAPTTKMLTFSRHIGNNVGLGLSVNSDKTFIENQTLVGIDFSYNLVRKENMLLNLGLKAGGNFFSVNLDGLETYNIVMDPSLQSVSNFIPNVGAGAYLELGKLSFSLGAPKLLDSDRARVDERFAVQATEAVHVYTTLGYEFVLNPRLQRPYHAMPYYGFKLKPRIMIRQVKGAPTLIDYNMMMVFNDKFELGATYRNSKAFAGLAKINIGENFAAGFAYEYNSRMQLANTGQTMELLLSYKFKEPVVIEEPLE